MYQTLPMISHLSTWLWLLWLRKKIPQLGQCNLLGRNNSIVETRKSEKKKNVII